jgi:hypothetical protein
MPGFHEGGALAECRKLGAQEMFDIKLLELEVGFFDEIGSMIAVHGSSPMKVVYCKNCIKTFLHLRRVTVNKNI